MAGRRARMKESVYVCENLGKRTELLSIWKIIHVSW